MFLLDGKRLNPGTPFEAKGVQYPANWLQLATSAQKTAIGITEVAEQPRPDDRYYWVTDNNDGTYTATPKDLAALVANATTQLNARAFSLLAPSDWMVVRASEAGGEAVPAAWLTWRAQIRTQAKAQGAAIAACTTVDDLVALPAVVWAHDPNYVAPV
jgi:hypothetical protein